MFNIEFIKQIFLSDVIGWVLAFIAGMIIYKLIDNMQLKIERHSVVKEIEDTFNRVFALEKAKRFYKYCKSKNGESSKKNNGDNKEENINIRTTLDDIRWKKFDSTRGDSIRIEGQRYILIKENVVSEGHDEYKYYNEYIGTQPLHEILILFRRIEKLYKDNIIKDADLSDLWREILSFACSGRIEFFKSYFSKYDLYSMIYIIIHTIIACEKNRNKAAVEGLKKEIKGQKRIDKDIIFALLKDEDNIKFRSKKFTKKYYLKKLEKILSKKEDG